MVKTLNPKNSFFKNVKKHGTKEIGLLVFIVLMNFTAWLQLKENTLTILEIICLAICIVVSAWVYIWFLKGVYKRLNSVITSIQFDEVKITIGLYQYNGPFSKFFRNNEKTIVLNKRDIEIHKVNVKWEITDTQIDYLLRNKLDVYVVINGLFDENENLMALFKEHQTVV